MFRHLRRQLADLISALRRSHQAVPTDHNVPTDSIKTGRATEEDDSKRFSSAAGADPDVIDIPNLLEEKRRRGQLRAEDDDLGVIDRRAPSGPPERSENEESPAPTRSLDPTVRDLANQFRIVADPTRLRILSALADGRLNVGEVCERLGGQSQPAVSHHLGLLRISGLVAPSREGKFNYYELTDLGQTLTEVAGWFDSPDGRTASELFRQLSDPTRLQILTILATGDRNVGELCSQLHQTQPAVSHHLAKMRGGLIEARREGKFSYYSLLETGQELIRVVDSLREAMGQGDSHRSEDSSEADEGEFSALPEGGMNAVPARDETGG